MNGTEHGHCPPELLEDAARGHLDPARMLEVENHCAVCSQCRDAYAQERRIAHGARSWARSALKKRLAGAVAEERATALPWQRIVAVAAVLLVIAGTGIVYRWLHRIPQEPLLLTESVITDSIAAAAQPSTADDHGQAMRSAAPGARQKEKNEAADGQISPTRPEGEPAAEARSLPSPAPALKEDLADAAESLAKSEDTGRIIWGTLFAEEEDKKGKIVSQAETQQTQISRNGMGSRVQSTIEPPRDKRSRATTNSVGAARSSAGTGGGAMGHGFVQSPNVFILEQQHILAMMRRDADERPDAVPARITRTGDTVHIVLLLSTLLPTDALRSASVTECSPDSLEVILPGRRIGFRVPGGLGR
jgi:hypothetical protein